MGLKEGGRGEGPCLLGCGWGWVGGWELCTTVLSCLLQVLGAQRSQSHLVDHPHPHPSNHLGRASVASSRLCSGISHSGEAERQPPDPPRSRIASGSVSLSSQINFSLLTDQFLHLYPHPWHPGVKAEDTADALPRLPTKVRRAPLVRRPMGLASGVGTW